MGFKKDVLDKLGKIESQLAVNNKILETHERRSTNLEERVIPLEQSHLFFNKLSKGMMALLGIIASCAAAYHYLLSK